MTNDILWDLIPSDIPGIYHRIPEEGIHTYPDLPPPRRPSPPPKIQYIHKSKRVSFIKAILKKKTK